MRPNYLLYAALGCTPLVAHAQERPNIVVYLTDDLGLTECEPYGSALNTPNMSRLSEEGITFNRAFVAAAYSGPSRASLFSGVMPPRHGTLANHNAPRMDMMTMVGRMQELGYEVVSIGKTGHGSRLTEKMGFDYLDPEDGPHPSDDVKLMNNLEKYLALPRSGKPLCIFVGDRRPHSPWYNDPVDSSTIEATYPSNLIDTPESRRVWGTYITDVKGVDKTLGKIDARFKEFFGGDDFLFMFTSDHGSSWMSRKGNLYDGGIHVPMMIRWPGEIKRNIRTEAMVSWIDIIPTFIDIAGGGEVEGIDGRSFKKVLHNPKKGHHEYIFATHNSREPADYVNRAVRSERFKYIRNYSFESYYFTVPEMLLTQYAETYWSSWEQKAKSDPRARAIIDRYRIRPYEELYDVVADPNELHNLALDPRYGEELKSMSTLLDKWQTQQGDIIKMPKYTLTTKGPEPAELREELVEIFEEVKAKK